MNIIILGPQGSGKGTQANKISKELNIPHIDAGNLLREETTTNSELSNQIKKTITKGELVTDDIVIEIVKKRLKKKDCKNGYILDGFPRTKYESQQLEKFTQIDKVILLEITDDLAVKRLSQRRQCTKCNNIYGIEILPKTKGICDNCGGILVQREDDTPAPIKKRLQIYHQEIKPIIEFYKTKKIMLQFDASKTAEKIFFEIINSFRK